ncbi:MAG: pseudaminic acid synthase [Sphingobacteriales bacterium]|jgi:pseudaminic acid synthase
MSVNIIAEISANHNGDLDLTKRTIEAIAKTGADTVKIQTYKPESLTLNVDNEIFGPLKSGPWKGISPHKLFSTGSLPYEWHKELKEFAESLGLIFFSTPFDLEGVKFLEELNVPNYKIASLEINHIPLIKAVAKTGKPIIMSTGVATLADISLAVETCRNEGNNDITLLKCTSEYPAPFEKANLLTIKNLQETFNVKVGVSDHTMGATIPVLSVGLGATVIEKHFILDRGLGGPDALFSMEPQEFEQMVKMVREAEKSVGKITYPSSGDVKLRKRSIFISEDMKSGDKFSDQNVKIVRPGHGIHPKFYDQIIGKEINASVKAGTPVAWTLVKD